MPEKINPYIAGAPVVEQRMFFGREDVFSWIERSLSGKFVDHILVIHGQRRVGKTSVLKHLSNRLPDRYIPIFIDLQGRTNTTLPRFLWWLAREISRALDLERPNREAFEDDPDYFESEFLPSVEDALGDNVLLLTFDEFDTLESTSAQERLALPFMAILKRLMEHKKLNFIFSIGSSGRKLENMQAAYTGFFKQALYRKISFLAESDARELITRPVDGVLSFGLDAVDRIYEITSGHPYFIQLICHELFSVAQKSDNWHISKSDVDGVLNAVIERGTVNLKFVWDEASELERWALASLAQFEESVDIGRLEDYLNKQRVRFIHQDLESAILHLREKDVLASGNRFVIYLMKLWLLQNRSIEQVREELASVNPIVSRLLQVGHEYLDQKEYQKAIDAFLEALQVEEDNYEIRMGLAGAYQLQEDYGRAAIEYEEVLSLYPEEVAAQSGFCDAYLALGDVRFSLGRYDEAEYAYQQVLKVSSRHTDGLRRMAKLHHHLAVGLITDEEKTALEQVRKALEYTPKDAILNESLRDLEALTEGKLDTKDVLFAWGKRARSDNNWRDAADLLEAYDRVGDKGEKAGELLDEVRAMARDEQLKDLRKHADRMERLSEFDEAIFALTKYLSLQPDDADLTQQRLRSLKETRKIERREEGGIEKQPFWKRPLVWAGLAVIAVVSGLLLFPGSPLRKASPPAESDSATESVSTEGEQNTVNQTNSTQLLTGDSSEAVESSNEALVLAESILASIQNQSPVFSDDFSDEFGPMWTYTHEFEYDTQVCTNPEDAAMSYSEGALQLSLGPECQSGHLSSTTSTFSSYVLQMQVDFQQAPHGFLEIQSCNEKSCVLSFEIHGDNYWSLGNFGNSPGYSRQGAYASGRFDTSQPVLLTMIVINNTQIVFLDTQMVAYSSELPTFTHPLSIGFHIYSQDNSLSEIEFLSLDNFRIWDISEIAEQMIILDSEINPDIAPFIRAANNSEPDFYEDFSNDYGTVWEYQIPEDMSHLCPNPEETELMIADEVLQVATSQNCPHRSLYSPGLREYTNYVMQVMLDFSSAPNSILEFQTSPKDDSSEGFMAFFIRGDGRWNLGDFENITFSNGMNSSGRFDASQPVRLTIAALGESQYVYLNGRLAVYNETARTEAVESKFGYHVAFSEDASSGEIEWIKMDNLAIWDLNDAASQIFLWEGDADEEITSIITDVSSRPPDFADNFSTVDENWSFGNTKGEEIDPKEFIIDGVMQFDINPEQPFFRFEHPAYENVDGDFVLQLERTQQNHNSFEFGFAEEATSIDIRNGWDINTCENEDCVGVDGGSIPSGSSSTRILTIIRHGTVYSFYMDSVLFAEYDTGTHIQVQRICTMVNDWSDELSGTQITKIDNFKIWNITSTDEASNDE